MMKTTRSELKSLIKECLVEILQEGLGSFPSTSTTLPRQSAPVQPLRPSADKVVYAEAKKAQSASLKEAIKREAGGNKVMESIFADTAANTLPQMLDNERAQPRAGGTIERIVANNNPEEIFGEDVTSKWATLAFTAPSTLKNRE